jgi:hypothetical protein
LKTEVFQLNNNYVCSVVSSGAPLRIMSYAEPQDASLRLTGFIVVAVFHVLMGYALVIG